METHRITTNLEDRVILVEFLTAEDRKEDRDNCMKQVSILVSKDSWNGLVIDIRKVMNPMPVVEQLQVGQNVQKSLMSLMKTAIIYNPDVGNVNEFISAVSVKRGRRLREFTEISAARAWVRETNT